MFAVVDTECVPLLGKKTCQKLGLVKRIYVVNNGHHFTEDYKDVFHGMGQLPMIHNIKLIENARPVVHSPRKVPISL